ncbi:MAG: Gx transporter family protein [Ruminococcaceae bacterium]|nr:Gx transporter family protein [Oscillospiraceae bacterium]
MNSIDKSKMTASKKLVITAFLVSVGMVLQIVEGMLDVFIVPGGKLGVANIVSLVDLFMLGGPNSIGVAAMRGFLGSMVYGGVSTLPYSLGGAVVSAVAMWIVKAAFYPKLSLVGISVIGAFFHNLTQIVVAIVVFGSFGLLCYLPVLTIVGTIGGVLTGYLAQLFCRKAGLIKI